MSHYEGKYRSLAEFKINDVLFVDFKTGQPEMFLSTLRSVERNAEKNARYQRILVSYDHMVAQASLKELIV
jgi:hypothetical protein